VFFWHFSKPAKNSYNTRFLLGSRSGSNGTTSGLETNHGLEGIVDPPLETSQSTDHDDSGTHTSPETIETDITVDFLDVIHSATTSLDRVELRDHSISGLGDQSAEDTGNITRSESDGELSGLGVFILGSGEDSSVEHLDSLFEGDELHDSVGDLSGPEGSKTLVETVNTFVSSDLSKTFSEGNGESTSGGSLDSDLNGFPRAQEDISNNFSGSGGKSPTDTLVFDGIFLTNDASIDILEEFVETELSETLKGITDQSRSETQRETTGTFSGLDGSESITNGLVLAGVDLHSALNDIQRADGSVGKTTSQSTTNHTLEIVGSIVFISAGSHCL